MKKIITFFIFLASMGSYGAVSNIPLVMQGSTWCANTLVVTDASAHIYLTLQPHSTCSGSETVGMIPNNAGFSIILQGQDQFWRVCFNNNISGVRSISLNLDNGFTPASPPATDQNCVY